jgi:exportin-7
LSAFIDDDELVLVILKFLGELVNNRCSRLRFDTWNINGLIAFKETAKIMIQFFKYYDLLKNKPVKRDKYREIFKYIDTSMTIFINCITGNFINFAVCDYYNDDTFSTFAEYTLATVVS